MPYPATIYSVVTTLESVRSPIDLDQIMIVGDIIDDDFNRGKVVELLCKLVSANLATRSKPNTPAKTDTYIITDNNTGVELKTPDVLEGRTYHLNVCTQIEVMTEFNDTTGSYILGASYLGSLGLPVESLLKKLQLLEDLIDAEGELAPGLDTYRHTLFTQLKTIAETTLDSKAYQSFYDSF